ncbi:hypothetical protein PanWU01x14_114640, partial [Parasponia andersonii]
MSSGSHVDGDDIELELFLTKANECSLRGGGEWASMDFDDRHDYCLLNNLIYNMKEGSKKFSVNIDEYIDDDEEQGLDGQIKKIKKIKKDSDEWKTKGNILLVPLVRKTWGVDYRIPFFFLFFFLFKVEEKESFRPDLNKIRSFNKSTKLKGCE